MLKGALQRLHDLLRRLLGRLSPRPSGRGGSNLHTTVKLGPEDVEPAPALTAPKDEELRTADDDGDDDSDAADPWDETGRDEPTSPNGPPDRRKSCGTASNGVLGPTQDDESGDAVATCDEQDSEERTEEPPVRDPSPPPKIGPRRESGMDGGNGPQNGSPFIRKPELICRQTAGARRWEIVLAWSDECDVQDVRRNGEILDIVDGECRIASFRGKLSVEYSDPERQGEEITLFDSDPLVFKLRKDWKGDGRKVRHVTKGYFIVIAPAEWDREGHIPVEPETCVDAEFTAHHFSRDGRESPKDLGGFAEWEGNLFDVGLEINGKTLFDDSEHGMLFIGDAPALRVPHGIVWARVGEERHSGWSGENFEPGERSLGDILNGRQGRFFVRVYDDDTRLIDSDQFRYLRDLREIRVNGKAYVEDTVLPPPYVRTTVEFVGADGVVIAVRRRGEADSRVAETERSVDAPRQPDWDFLECDLEAGDGLVRCAIRLPRVWWRMEPGGDEVSEWRDTPISLTREEFSEEAKAGAIIRVRVSARIKSLSVGFDDELDRSHQANRVDCTNNNGKREVELPLMEFADCTQISERLFGDVSFNARCGGQTLALVTVRADPAPTILTFDCTPTSIAADDSATLRWDTRYTDGVKVEISPAIGLVEPCGSLEVSPTETTTYTLRLVTTGMVDVARTVTVALERPTTGRPVPWVRRSGGGWRHGKGFSLGELQKAGFAVDDVKRSIPIDRRRRSVHPVNVNTLKDCR